MLSRSGAVYEVDKFLTRDAHWLTSCSVQISSIHQQMLGQAVGVVKPAALSEKRSLDYAKVTHVITKPCWRRPKGCYCRCHTSHERTWHSALLGTIGFASLFDRCNRDTCDTRRYAVYARFALSRFGVPLAIRLATELKVHGGFVPVLYPTIDVQRVCNFTSPGFRLLEDIKEPPFQVNIYLDHDERLVCWHDMQARTIADIKRLFANGEVSHLDVDPEGRTWLEVPLQTQVSIQTMLTVFRNFFWSHGRQAVCRHNSSSLHSWVGGAGKTSRATPGRSDYMLVRALNADESYCVTDCFCKSPAGSVRVHT